MRKLRTTRFLLPSLLTIILLITGCQQTGSGYSAEMNGIGEGSADPEAMTTQADSIDSIIFPKDQVVDVKITIDEEDFQDMLENASAEEYKEASVNYNGVQFDHVGIRTKGNLSLRSVVNSDSDRYSFKISFDEYINQTFQGISKINLNNNYSDASYMREFLTYELAQSVGLPTPKFSYVNVYVNEELWGFYLAIEQIGTSYLERHFDQAYGALYKAEMTGVGGDLAWLGSDADAYTGLVKKSKKSKDDALIEMLDELNNGSQYEQVLDVDNVLKYVALNVVASNMDSYLGMNKQNYYLYETDGVFSVLPWDYNMAFGGFGGSEILIDEPTQGALAERPLIAKLLEVDAYKERYHEIISNMLQGYMKQESFDDRVEQLKTLISEHVQADPRPFFSYEEYEESLPILTAFAESSSNHIQQQLDGTIASAGDGSGSGMGPGGGMGGMGQMGGMGSMRPGGGGVPPDQGNGANPTDTPMPADGALQAPPGMQGQNGQAELRNFQQGPFGNGAGGMPGGRGNGMMGRPGDWGFAPASEQGNLQEAIYAGVSVVLLLLACAFVTMFRRKRL